uniref:TMV resistance protein N-like n=2 Tax=Nicotiana TaxID=4085 RepID=A0A1S4C1J2_TOBAC
MADQKGKDQSSNIQPSFALGPWKYDVFLSCIGGDASQNFVDQLYLKLCQVRINTFKTDDVSAEVVMNAIEGSIIFIIVLSKNYASSRRCLNELLHILELKKNSKRLLLPIFYDIDPSDVRKQTGIFAEAFERHRTCSQSEQTIQYWKTALNKVGNLSGWDLRHAAEG